MVRTEDIFQRLAAEWTRKVPRKTLESFVKDELRKSPNDGDVREMAQVGLVDLGIKQLSKLVGAAPNISEAVFFEILRARGIIQQLTSVDDSLLPALAKAFPKALSIKPRPDETVHLSALEVFYVFAIADKNDAIQAARAYPSAPDKLKDMRTAMRVPLAVAKFKSTAQFKEKVIAVLAKEKILTKRASQTLETFPECESPDRKFHNALVYMLLLAGSEFQAQMNDLAGAAFKSDQDETIAGYRAIARLVSKKRLPANFQKFL
ncbi:MAG: hypothetical protein JNM27_17515 [Leptospirales bacterium]|nr:hypothetical protein [Leptospirales bacterium]